MGGVVHAQDKKLTVFAAASLKDVIEDLRSKFETACDCKVLVSFGGSGALARQIDAGAPAGVYISADPVWMDWLKTRNAIVENSERSVAGNALVVVASRKRAQFSSLSEIAGSRFAMGEPDSVPAGRYARQAFRSAKLWDAKKNQAIPVENVRVALSMVSRGIVPMAVVYASDLIAAPDLHPLFFISPEHHDPIIYKAGLTNAGDKIAQEFLDFVSTADAKSVFTRYGFQALAN